MTRIVKFTAVVLSIAIFAMPAATLSLHCVFMDRLGNSPHPQCSMMGMNPPADQMKAGPNNRACCEVSAPKPESIIVPQAPAGSGVTAPLTSQASLSDLPSAPVFHEPSNWLAQSPGAPPQAVLCTFLI